LLTILNNGLIPSPLASRQLVGSLLVTLTVAFSPLTFLQRSLVLLIESKCSEGKVLLSHLFYPRVGIIHYVDALKLEVENLCKVDVVQRVCFVNLVFHRLRWSRGRFVIVKREVGRRGWF